MRPNQARDLDILTAIGEGAPLTQRALAQRLGVALGLTNLYLKRLAHKGLIKIVAFPQKPAARKRLRYLLTSKGFAEKSRLTYEHMSYSLQVYRRTRQTLRESLGRLPAAGFKRLALYGAGEAAELAYLTLREFEVELVGVFDERGGGQLVGLDVRPLSALTAEQVDAVIVATFDRPEPHVRMLERLGVPRERCVTMRRLAAAGDGT